MQGEKEGEGKKKKKREKEGGEEEVAEGITRRRDATWLPALALIIRLRLFGAGARAASLLLAWRD